MGIGGTVKQLRLALGLTQDDVAQALGYKSRSAVAKIESGAADVPTAKLLALARVLDTSVEGLLTGAATSHVDRAAAGGKAANPQAHRVGAVILAGGKSSRNRQNTPNQFADVLGRPVVAYSMEAYQRNPLVNDIVVVCLRGWEQVVSAYADAGGIDKLAAVVPAGASGVLSARAGFDYLANDAGYQPDDLVIFQGSTRPMVSQEAISKLVGIASQKGSAVTCEPLDNTMPFLRTDDGFASIDRQNLFDVQSPEAFAVSVLHGVFARADAAQVPLTMNMVSLLMDALGDSLNLCGGVRNNIKIVRQDDVALATALIRRRVL